MAAPAEHPQNLEAPVIYVQPATIKDVHWISSRLRKADREEIAASSGEDPFTSLSKALYTGKLNFVAIKGGQPIALFGTSATFLHGADNVAWIWMVGTDQMTLFPKAVLRVSKEWLSVLSLSCDLCMNYVDARNTKHRNWLEHLGFTIEEQTPVFLEDPKVPFYVFYKAVKEAVL